MTTDIIKLIDEHWNKAIAKHPAFCNGKLLASDKAEVYAEDESISKQICEINLCAENILGEEIDEMCNAIAHKDWASARSELYDAIAVLLRLDVEIVNRIGGAK